MDAWAGAVCGAVGSWLTGINELGAQLGTDVQGIADLDEGRDLLVTFMEDVVGLTDDMLGSVEDAGAPDIERGDELAADLLAALEPVKATFEDAVVEAQNLPTDDPDDVLRGGDRARQLDHGLAGRVPGAVRRAAAGVRQPGDQRGIRDGAGLRQRRLSKRDRACVSRQLRSVA